MKRSQRHHTNFYPHLRNPRHSTAWLRSLCVLCWAAFGGFLVQSSIGAVGAQAQLQQREPVVWRVGIFGNYGTNVHQAMFGPPSELVRFAPQYDTTVLPAVQSLLPYTGGSGTGFTVGALFEKPFSHDFSLAGRISLTNLSGTMSLRDSAAFGLNGGDVSAQIESRFVTSLMTISLEPLAAWHPFPNASVYLGGRIGVNLGTLRQELAIINDATGLIAFPDINQTSVVVTPERNIPNLYFPHVSLLAGLSYAIPLDIDETLFLAPEVWYAQNFTPFVRDLPTNQTWTINSLRGGVSFRYSPEAARRYLPPAIVRTAETPRLAINITPIALDSSGGESPLLRLRMEETFSRQMHPLLPYIFFDKNSDVLAARYLRLLPTQTASFSEKIMAKWGTLDIYYHALNIIGKRLKENPTASIRIVGCVSADEERSDSSHIAFATRRAEAVMTYLRDVWRIPMERLVVEARGLPAEANTLSTEAAQAENRRVEIYSDVWNILRPLTLADTLLESTPPAVKFLLRASTQGRISKWRFKIDQSKQTIQTLSYLGAPDSVVYWHPSREQRTVPRTEDAIRCNFDFLEEEGEGGSATISIPIEQRTIAKKRRTITLDGSNDADKSIETYRFIQFAPNSSSLTPAHERILGEIAGMRIDAAAKVFITGYTDTMGNPTRNTELSTNRAKEIAKTLTQIISPGNHVPTPIVAGRGGSMGIYPDHTPEGRCYSRLVEIRIETPAQGR